MNTTPNRVLDRNSCTKTFFLFDVSINDFIIGIYTYFTHITAFRTVIDDVTNEVTLRIFSNNL